MRLSHVIWSLAWTYTIWNIITTFKTFGICHYFQRSTFTSSVLKNKLVNQYLTKSAWPHVIQTCKLTPCLKYFLTYFLESSFTQSSSLNYLKLLFSSLFFLFSLSLNLWACHLTSYFFSTRCICICSLLIPLTLTYSAALVSLSLMCPCLAPFLSISSRVFSPHFFSPRLWITFVKRIKKSSILACSY